jgi:hypothetical protein
METSEPYGDRQAQERRQMVTLEAEEGADAGRLETIVAGLGERFDSVAQGPGAAGRPQVAVTVIGDLELSEAARRVADALYAIDLDWPRVVSFFDPAEF